MLAFAEVRCPGWQKMAPDIVKMKSFLISALEQEVFLDDLQ